MTETLMLFKASGTITRNGEAIRENRPNNRSPAGAVAVVGRLPRAARGAGTLT
ncbi:hypothetical protein [Streptomyces sp. NPDC006463]|uniref:hypothetical protein n=1 Tax=Streptomyces sp. NPDC006463 TaxID=3364746 RepID=UPI0036CF650E